jgi:hypothetical protein
MQVFFTLGIANVAKERGIFPDSDAVGIIVKEQKHYCQIKEYLLFEYCKSRQFEDTMKEIIEVNKAVQEFE